MTNITSRERVRPGIIRLLEPATMLLAVAVLYVACAAPGERNPSTSDTGVSTRMVGGGCEDCELIYDGMPPEPAWETTMAPSSEPGERLEISGVVRRVDGRTPAPDVILYMYHTDANGYYSPAPGAERRNRHGHLRGWMKTNPTGEYRFTSIRPAPYPQGEDPAHIHVIVKEAGMSEYYIDDYMFDDDSLLTGEQRSRLSDRGGSGIIHLTKGTDGVWRGRRDIILGQNVPGYQ